MPETHPDQLEQRLCRGLRRLLAPGSPAPALAGVVERLRSRGWSAALFGGSLRDLVVGRAPVAPRDFDVVVAGVTVEALEEVFATHVRRRTRFGGLHLLVEGMPFDVWPLEQTWAFQACPGLDRSFAMLPRTTFLNVEAVAAEITGPGSGMIHEAGAFAAVLSRTLEINLEPNPSPLQCVLRSLTTAARLGYAIGPRLAHYLAAQGAAVGAEALAGAQQPRDADLTWGADDFRNRLDALTDWVSTRGDTAIDLHSLDRWHAARLRSLGTPRTPSSDSSSRS
jgi:hypothetical protein